MATITRTTQPLSVEIQLPDSVVVPSLSAESSIYADWVNTFANVNPIEAQVAFFQDLAERIQNEELDIEFYQYWYNKVKTSHTAVLSGLSAVEEFTDINESLGTLWFANANSANTANSSLSSTTLKPYPTNIETLLPSGLATLITDSYTTVNNLYATNLVNISSISLPSTAHGTSLVKDTVAITRNTSSKSLILAELEEEYGIVLELTELKNTITGDISIASSEYETDIEGTTVTVDNLTNKIKPTESTLVIDSLRAQ